jgi:hypothetical protein
LRIFTKYHESLHRFQYFFRSINSNRFLSHHLGGHLIDLVAGGSGGDGNLAGVQAHMAFLDALGGQGAQGG